MTALRGLRVLDFTSGFSGAIATMLLCDNGAEVIKVESSHGDASRRQPAWIMWHRGKKSVVLDLKTSGGVAAARDLARATDVVVENFRPGVAERLGIGYRALSKANPELVYCSITGFGPGGAHASLKGYEGIVAAKIGRLAREEGWRKEGPIFFALPVLSFGAGQLAAQGVLAALWARGRTGRGQWVRTSLAQAAMAYANSNWMVRVGEEETLQVAAKPWISPHENMAAGYQIAECADGRWIQIASTTVRLFRSFMRVIGMEDVYDDPRFADMPYTFPSPEERAQVLARIRARLKDKRLAEWMRLFDEDGNVGGEPFITTQEAMSHPQFLHNGHVIEVRDPRFGVTRQIGPLAKMSETPSQVQGPAPDLGQHTREILGETAPAHRPWGLPGDAPRTPQAHLRHALQGINVLELGNHIAGPFGATLLAEMGARVIKVEPPEGDLLRRIMDASVKTIQGKESIAVDLKTDEGRAILYKLVAKADVLLQNFRPGLAEKLGIEYERLIKINPRLVYLYAAAYGASGPRAGRPAFGPAMNAITGAGYYVNGEGNPPQSGIHADPSSALGTATAVLVGLHARESTGRGQYIETTMLCSASYALSDDFLQYDGKPPRRLPDTGQHGFHALYRLYRTKDGWVFLACPREEEWRRFCQAAGRKELPNDPRFDSPRSRLENDGALLKILQAMLKARATGEWERLLWAHDVPCAQADGEPFKAFFVRDPGIKQNGFLARTQYVDYFADKDHYVDFGEYWRHGNTVLFSDLEGVTGAPCGIGDHTQSIMIELGYEELETERLKAAGVVTWGIGWAARG